MREKRRQRIQEAAMKAPVKIMIPLVLFIFPTIFIILLGPAAIIIMEMFIG
jgi:tight adherence protein C